MAKVWQTLDGTPTRIIAHRGASAYLPEHTLEGYALAIEQGAELIEPDLVPSRDGVLVARHDRGLARSTDVAQHQEFASRARALDDGRRDWMVEDFDWHELQRLRAIQPFPGRDTRHDGKLALVRFEQVLELAQREGARLGRTIGVYPELKHATLFEQLGYDVTGTLIGLLEAHGHRGSGSSVWVQCFEREPLLRCHAALALPVFVLLDADEASSPHTLLALAHQLPPAAGGIAVAKAALFEPDGTPGALVGRAHAAGMRVHAWTFRNDRPSPLFTTAQAEYEACFALGVDALFSDFPDVAVAAREHWTGTVERAGRATP